MKRIMFIASALALAACSNGGSSNSAAPAGGIPGKLADHPVVSKAALTSTQKTDIKNFSAKMEKMPDSSLFLPAQNESDADRTQRNEKKNKLSPDGKLNYDRIQNNCQFQVPQPSGSEQSSTITTSIGGNGCPISFNQTVKSEMISQPDGKSSTFKSTASGDLQVLDPSMQNQVGIRKATTNFSVNGTFISSEKSSSSYMSGSGGVNLQTVNGQNALMNMSYEMLASDDKMTSYTEVSFTLDSISATIQMYVDSSQGSQGAKILLNGQPTTDAELKEIFGDNFNMQATKN